jgi:hypothetical protein
MPDWEELINIVVEKTAASFKVIYIDGKPVESLANFGAPKNSIAIIDRSGEYSGLKIELMENTSPVLTDNLVIRILKQLRNENFMTPLEILDIELPDQLYYILNKWFKKATDAGPFFQNKNIYPELDYLIRVSSSPISVPVKVVEIGMNTKTSQPVVPQDWIGRIFANGTEMQAEMSQLESRQGHPPVTYAITYNMNIVKEETIITEIPDDCSIYYYLWMDNGCLKCGLVEQYPEGCHYVKYNTVLIGFIPDDILVAKTDTNNSRSVGVQVSRIQKAIRRGRMASKSLIQTIAILNECPNYNMPEHNFVRVSASKQIAWRLAITIWEDCRPYLADNEPSSLALILLVLVTQRATEFKFTDTLLQNLTRLAVLAQFNDSPKDKCSWDKLKKNNLVEHDKNNTHRDSLWLAITHIKMMKGDREMLGRYVAFKDKLKPWKIPLNIGDIGNKVLYHSNLVHTDVMLSSYDQHSKPNIILHYQGCAAVGRTTQEISKYIWDVSSSYNIRSGEGRPPLDSLLVDIQKWYHKNPKLVKDGRGPYTGDYLDKPVSTKNARLVFLMMFGTSYRVGNAVVIIAGKSKQPIRVKKSGHWEYSASLDLVNKFPKKTHKLSNFTPPLGYYWNRTNVTAEIINGKPYLDGVKVKYYDGSCLLESAIPANTLFVNDKIQDICQQVFMGEEIKLARILMLRTKSYNIDSNYIPIWGPVNHDMHIMKTV